MTRPKIEKNYYKENAISKTWITNKTNGIAIKKQYQELNEDNFEKKMKIMT